MQTDANAARYVTDVPYARRFVRELSPAWLDFTATSCGFAAPQRAEGFAWCELGCGHGVTPALLAATHPEGRFVGVDLMADHIAFADRLCRAAGLDNAAFHARDFAAATALDLPRFDYIVAHGVYTWVDDAAQADLLRFVDRHLKPGGILYLSYNSLPGWAADMPLQHLLLTLSQRAAGDGVARLDSADRILAAMAAAGAGLGEGAMAREWRTLRAKLPPAYFVHELLPPAWRPIYVTELRRAAAAHGLAPIGSATLRDNVDAFSLPRAAQEVIAGMADPDLRELLRDYFLMKRFRRDVFGRGVSGIAAAEARRRILATRFMLAEVPADPDAAPVAFASVIAQRVLALLADGPAAPAALVGEGVARDPLVGEVLALAAAGRIWPLDPRDATGDGWARMNAVLQAWAGTPDEIGFSCLASGTVVELGADRLRDAGEPAST